MPESSKCTDSLKCIEHLRVFGEEERRRFVYPISLNKQSAFWFFNYQGLLFKKYMFLYFKSEKCAKRKNAEIAIS